MNDEFEPVFPGRLLIFVKSGRSGFWRIRVVNVPSHVETALALMRSH